MYLYSGDRYGRVYYTYIFLGQILKCIPAIWGQVGKCVPVFWGQVWKGILYIYFLGTDIEGYTCNLGTGRKMYTCILGTGMEGYCWGQVRKFYLYSGDRYGRLLLATSKEVLPVFWGQVWKAIAGGQVRKVLPVFW